MHLPEFAKQNEKGKRRKVNDEEGLTFIEGTEERKESENEFTRALKRHATAQNCLKADTRTLYKGQIHAYALARCLVIVCISYGEEE